MYATQVLGSESPRGFLPTQNLRLALIAHLQPGKMIRSWGNAINDGLLNYGYHFERLFNKNDRRVMWESRRGWDYTRVHPNGYCLYCNNLDLSQPPRDFKGRPRILEPDPFGLALRRPAVKDFTPRRNHTLKTDRTARQPTRWQFVRGEKLSFDIPYEDLLQGGQAGCPSCALLFDIGFKFENMETVEKYFQFNENYTAEPVSGIDSSSPEDVMGMYVDIFPVQKPHGSSLTALRIKTFSGIDIDVFSLSGKKNPFLQTSSVF
jgi:hypothetical protein